MGAASISTANPRLQRQSLGCKQCLEHKHHPIQRWYHQGSPIASTIRAGVTVGGLNTVSTEGHQEVDHSWVVCTREPLLEFFYHLYSSIEASDILQVRIRHECSQEPTEYRGRTCRTQPLWFSIGSNFVLDVNSSIQLYVALRAT